MTRTTSLARLSGLHHRTRHRAVNCWRDIRAMVSGYCNDCPWRASPNTGGGYTFWRCSRPRGHSGLHRYQNYVWPPGGGTIYSPQPDVTAQPWERTATPTLRQARAARQGRR